MLSTRSHSSHKPAFTHCVPYFSSIKKLSKAIFSLSLSLKHIDLYLSTNTHITSHHHISSSHPYHHMHSCHMASSIYHMVSTCSSSHSYYHVQQIITFIMFISLIYAYSCIYACTYHC